MQDIEHDIDLLIRASRKNWDDRAKRHEKWLEQEKIRLREEIETLQEEIETLQEEIEARSDGGFIFPPPVCKKL